MAGTPAETLEEFKIRIAQQYDDTNPVEVQIMSLGTYIDVPELCPAATSEAADELLAMMGDFNHMSACNDYMTKLLADESEKAEMTLDKLIEMHKPDLVMANQEKQDNLDDLFTFAGREGEDMQQFTDRMKAEFTMHLEETGRDLVDSMITVPEVPELADDDTEEARDELQKLVDDIEWCLTFTEWLSEEIFVPCDVLRQTLEDTLTTNSERQTMSEENQMSLLSSLKALKDEENLTDNEFTVKMGQQYLMEGNTDPADTGITLLPVP